MHLNGLDLLFWAAGLVGHITLLFVLLRKRYAGTYPIFTALIGGNVIRTIALYVILHFGTKSQYYFAYWWLEILDTALQLGVVYEVTSHIFRPRGEWARDVRGNLGWLICLSLVTAAGLTWLASPPTRFWMQTLVIKGDFFSSVCLSELFVGMLALSVAAALPWKTPALKISLGLGVYSTVEVIIEAAHGYFGIGRDNQVYVHLSHLRMAIYLCCLGYWIVSLWQEEPAPQRLTSDMHSQMAELQQEASRALQKLRSEIPQ
jgi:hypothetical protein